MDGGRYQRVWLNGIDFASVHPALLLQHISESNPEISQKWSDRPGGGQILTGSQITHREITIEFAIREALDYMKRLEVYTAVCAWCSRGGWLEISSRLGKRIYVTVSKLPAIGKLREWNENLSITFTAGWYPYWQDIAEHTKTEYLVSNSTTTIFVSGNVPSGISARIVPSDALTDFALAVDATDSRITISPKTAIAAGAEVVIGYDNRHLLRITVDGTPLSAYRTGSDELIANPGAAMVGFFFNTPCNLFLTSRGAWL